MIQILGAALVAGCCAWLGMMGAGRLQNRVRALRALCAGLEEMERELSLCRTPLPELMERLAREAPPPARPLFAGCVRALEELEREEFFQAWDRLAGGLSGLTEEDRRALRPLGRILGRYDAPGQVRAVEHVREELERLCAAAREDSRRLGSVYRALGAAGGGFLVILLL